MTAAETGHLVFATLHTNSAVESIDRMVGVFRAERQQQVRLQLSTTIQAVLSQQLLLRKSGHGRVVACEVMIITAAIRNMIREAKTPQMQSALVSSSAVGSISMDNNLVQMVKDGSISLQQAVNASANPDHIKKNAGGQSFHVTKNY
jgi:twitching motility protein PilT